MSQVNHLHKTCPNHHLKGLFHDPSFIPLCKHMALSTTAFSPGIRVMPSVPFTNPIQAQLTPFKWTQIAELSLASCTYAYLVNETQCLLQ